MAVLLFIGYVGFIVGFELSICMQVLTVTSRQVTSQPRQSASKMPLIVMKVVMPSKGAGAACEARLPRNGFGCRVPAIRER